MMRASIHGESCFFGLNEMQGEFDAHGSHRNGGSAASLDVLPTRRNRATDFLAAPVNGSAVMIWQLRHQLTDLVPEIEFEHQKDSRKPRMKFTRPHDKL